MPLSRTNKCTDVPQWPISKSTPGLGFKGIVIMLYRLAGDLCKLVELKCHFNENIIGFFASIFYLLISTEMKLRRKFLSRTILWKNVNKGLVYLIMLRFERYFTHHRYFSPISVLWTEQKRNIFTLNKGLFLI